MAILATLRRGAGGGCRWASSRPSLVSACCSGSSAGDSSSAKKITFWYSTSAQDKGYTDLAKEFQAKEGISVEIVNIPYDGYQDKLRQAAQANSLPDTASVPSLDTPLGQPAAGPELDRERRRPTRSTRT